MNPIIKELLENNIEISIKYDEDKKVIKYIVNGFYKSGTVTLFEEGNKLIAIDRDKDETSIETLKDIAWLNYHWWQISKERYEGWMNPDTQWIPLLISKGLIREEIKQTKIYHAVK